MVDFSHVISGQYNGHAIKKIEKDGVTLWEVGGPTPTINLIDFTDATIVGSAIKLADDNKYQLSNANKYSLDKTNSKFKIVKGPNWPADTRVSVSITLGYSVTIGKPILHIATVDDVTTFGSYVPFDTAITVGPVIMSSDEVALDQITTQLRAGGYSLEAGEPVIDGNGKYHQDFYNDFEKTQLAATLYIKDLSYADIVEYDYTETNVNLQEMIEAITNSTYVGKYSKLDKYGLAQCQYCIYGEGKSFSLETGWTLSSSNQTLRHARVYGEGASVTNNSAISNGYGYLIDSTSTSGHYLGIASRATNSYWPKDGSSNYAKNLIFTGPLTAEIRDDSNNLAATVSYTAIKLLKYVEK